MEIKIAGKNNEMFHLVVQPLKIQNIGNYREEVFRGLVKARIAKFYLESEVEFWGNDLKEFVDTLSKMESLEEKKCKFISTEGSFEIQGYLESTGNIAWSIILNDTSSGLSRFEGKFLSDLTFAAETLKQLKAFSFHYPLN